MPVVEWLITGTLVGLVEASIEADVGDRGRQEDYPQLVEGYRELGEKDDKAEANLELAHGTDGPLYGVHRLLSRVIFCACAVLL